MYRKCLVRPSTLEPDKTFPVEAWVLTHNEDAELSGLVHPIVFVPVGELSAKIIASNWAQFLGNELEEITVGTRESLEFRIRHRSSPTRIERIVIVVDGEAEKVWPVLGDFIEL